MKLKQILVVCGVFASGVSGAEVPEENISAFALWSGLPIVEVEAMAEMTPYLLEVEAVYSAGGFNPYLVDFESVEEFEQSNLTPERAYKWLRYRREDLGVCFEDEELDRVSGLCKVKQN